MRIEPLYHVYPRTTHVYPYTDIAPMTSGQLVAGVPSAPPSGEFERVRRVDPAVRLMLSPEALAILSNRVT